MSVLTRMYRGETHFDFVGISKKTLLVSAALVVLSLLTLVVRPLNLSIDFTGGVIVTVENEADADITVVRSSLAGIGQAGARVQLTGEGFILIQTEALDAASQDELIQTAAEVAGTEVNSVTIDAVGPTFGAEVTRAAIEALVVFLFIVALFITWRFEWKMAAAALAALFHDIGKPSTREFGPGGVSFHHHEVVGARLTRRRSRLPGNSSTTATFTFLAEQTLVNP